MFTKRAHTVQDVFAAIEAMELLGLTYSIEKMPPNHANPDEMPTWVLTFEQLEQSHHPVPMIEFED